MSNDSLTEAKQLLRDNWDKGIDCPCCGQLVKKYSRKLTSSMAGALISLYNNSKNEVHISEIEHVNGGEFAQLERWGLIRQLDNTDTTKRTSGMWVIEPKGKAFVMGQIQVPMYCDTYNGKTLSFSAEMTTIKQALGNKFDYSELMGFEPPAIPTELNWLRQEQLV